MTPEGRELLAAFATWAEAGRPREGLAYLRRLVIEHVRSPEPDPELALMFEALDDPRILGQVALQDWLAPRWTS